MEKIRALVVDDTIVYRKIVSDVLKDIPGVEVVGTANNGKIALSKIASLKPDLITLDIEMPEVNGIEVLQELKNKSLDPSPMVIMLSTLTQQGSEMTIKALELSDKLRSDGYVPYKDDHFATQRVGVRFKCADIDLEEMINKIRRRYNSKAWYLVPQVSI